MGAPVTLLGVSAEPLALPSVPAGGAPYLLGNYAPVAAELTLSGGLEVEGALPPWLDGMLVRNGPNPVLVPDPHHYHWHNGDGMVHAVEFSGGRALAYRNRLVRTRKLASVVGTSRPPGPAEPVEGPANTNVIWHGGRLLALAETGFPYRLSADLDTLCVEDFDATLTGPMTAHPRTDPDTGALVAFGYDVFGPPYLRYYELDAAGAMVHGTSVSIPRATMQHDFCVSERRVGFLDLPVVFDLTMARGGASLPFRWATETRARLGLLDRLADGAEVRWLSLEPCFVLHVMNAFDDGDDFVVDLCRYDRAFDGTNEAGALDTAAFPRLERWRVTPDGTVEATQLDDRPVDYPRVDEQLAGRPYRFGYCTELTRERGVDTGSGLVRYDLVRDEASHHRPGPGRAPGEPIFVRAPDGRADDEGVVLSFVYDAGRDATDVVVIDGTAFDGAPLATVHLPTRVPFGLHGSFVPADRYR